jgi:hypothetical protein
MTFWAALGESFQGTDPRQRRCHVKSSRKSRLFAIGSSLPVRYKLTDFVVLSKKVAIILVKSLAAARVCRLGIL